MMLIGEHVSRRGCNYNTFFGEVQLLASMGLLLLLCIKLLQNVQEKQVSHIQGAKTEWCDQHQIVRFSTELLKKPGTLGPSVLIQKFPDDGDIVPKPLTSFLPLLLVKLVHLRLKDRKRLGLVDSPAYAILCTHTHSKKK